MAYTKQPHTHTHTQTAYVWHRTVHDSNKPRHFQLGPVSSGRNIPCALGQLLMSSRKASRRLLQLLEIAVESQHFDTVTAQ